MITPEQVYQWCAQKEGERLEFKAATSDFRLERLLGYMVALANEGGGRLLLGIQEKPNRHVVGTRAFGDLDAVKKTALDKLGFRIDVDEVRLGDARVLVLTAPSRPRGTAYHLDGRDLMRCGESLVPMSEDRLRQIFSEGRPDWLDEPSRTGLSDAEVVELLDAQAYFELLRQSYPPTRDGVLDSLLKDRLIVRESGGFSIKRIGGLLLARRLEDFPDLARKRPRVVVYDGTGKLRTKREQIGIKGYASGFAGLVEFINGQLPQNEEIGRAFRTQARLIPEIVVRELVANALLHQDFAIVGAGVDIEIYDNRIVFSNPGTPIVDVQRFIDGYQSRNERLADLFRRMGICEEKGSGIDKVIYAAEVGQLPAPDFRAALGRTEAIVLGPLPFDEMNRDDRVRACYQHCVLRWVMHQPMTNRSLRERFRFSEDRAPLVSQVISATEEAGLIKRDLATGSSRKLARYLPNWI